MTTTADLLAINAIRTLSIDAIEKANSGHPGLPMGAAQWHTHYGRNKCAIIQKTQNGLTATALFFPQDTVPCYYTAFSI